MIFLNSQLGFWCYPPIFHFAPSFFLSLFLSPNYLMIPNPFIPPSQHFFTRLPKYSGFLSLPSSFQSRWEMFIPAANPTKDLFSIFRHLMEPQATLTYPASPGSFLSLTISKTSMFIYVPFKTNFF